ncbi:MAG: MATE family efflux transporter [Lachnospiraceae bacterium]|nr:MATE family efflux transporter [Lachnospiraceae bacterium]MBQ1721653.1 MATE family efflux transporter [Lachnospiraceae bacterium]
MAKSMTEGKPLKLILQFALPLLLGNLFQQTYNIIDAAIVGRVLGAKALASVGATSSVQFLILGFCIGCMAGFAVPVAQRFGAGDYKSMRRYIYLSGILTVGLMVILTVTCSLLTNQILHLLSTPASIYQGAYDYIIVIFLGMPFTLAYNLLSSILRAVGDSKMPFIFLVVATVINIVLDLFFIIGLGWGCMGAALATIIAQGVSAICCLIFIHFRYELLIPRKEDRKWNGKKVGNLLYIGVPMGLQFSITAIGSMMLQAANNGLGDVYVSAFTAATRIKQFSMSPFDALATGVSTFASQNYGAGKYKRIEKGIKQGINVGIGYGIFIGLVLMFFGRDLSMIFISGKEVAVLDAAGYYLRCTSYFWWSLGILNVARLSIQGLGYSNLAIFSGVMELIARAIISLVLVPLYQFTAVSFADPIAWLSGALYCGIVCIVIVKRIQKKDSASLEV